MDRWSGFWVRRTYMERRRLNWSPMQLVLTGELLASAIIRKAARFVRYRRKTGLPAGRAIRLRELAHFKSPDAARRSQFKMENCHPLTSRPNLKGKQRRRDKIELPARL